MQKIKVFLYSILMVSIFTMLHLIFPDNWNSPVKQAIDGFFAGDISNLFAFIGLALLALIISFFGVICLCIIEPNKGAKNFYYPNISIIIAARDEAPLIKQTLKSIIRANYPKENIEVILVTSNSTDGSELQALWIRKAIIEKVMSIWAHKKRRSWNYLMEFCLEP